MGHFLNVQIPKSMTSLIAGSQARVIKICTRTARRSFATRCVTRSLLLPGSRGAIYAKREQQQHSLWQREMYASSPIWLKRSCRGMAGRADYPEAPKDAEKKKVDSGDPRIDDLGRAIEDDYATIRENYGVKVSTKRKHSID